MTQTPDGYLWLGTLDCLVRFDGAKSDLLPALHAALEGRRFISPCCGLEESQ